MYGQCFYVLRGMLWYSDLADNRRFFVYISIKCTCTKRLFYFIHYGNGIVGPIRRMKRSGGKRKKKKKER